MHRRTLLATAAVALAGCSGGDSNGDGDGNDTEPATPTNSTDTTDGSGDDSLPSYEFEGDGTATRDEIDINGGVVLADATHDGDGEFVVELLGEPRDRTMIDTAGTFDGGGANWMFAESKAPAITASGAWTLTIRQPRPTTGDTPPVAYEGTGDAVRGPVAVNGAGTATASGGIQSAILYPPTNSEIDRLFLNGPGEEPYSVPGVAFVDVDATGDWTLTFE